MATSKDPKKIDSLLTRGVAEIIDKTSLKKKLLSGRVLRVKFGIDPTGPRLHLGRSIPILKLRDFQELGHKIVLIIGDFTGLIGDTSDKTSERPMLDRKVVEANMKDYTKQFKLILDMTKVEIRYNSEWLGKLDFHQIAQMADLFSVHDFIMRENIKLRLDAGKRVSLREVLYPIMQGYDSVAVKADVEIGGTDQRFNLLAGRTMQPAYGQTTQDILMNPLMNGLDGQKMSTSQGNTVNILDSPGDQFGKIMSLTDGLIIPYFQLLTRVPAGTIQNYQKELDQGSNPRDLKMELAETIVSIYHGYDQAKSARENFVNVFQKDALPSKIPQLIIKKKSLKAEVSLADLMVKSNLAKSKSEAKRLIEQKAVKVNQITVTDWRTSLPLKNGLIISVGKRKFVQIKVE